MIRRWSIVLGLVAASLAACTASVPAPAGFAFPRHGWTDGGPAALGSGTLEFDDGCLYLVPNGVGARYLIVWPGDATLAILQGEPAVIIDGRTVTLGDDLQMSGGFYSDLSFVLDQLQDSVLPPACVTDEIFIATGFA